MIPLLLWYSHDQTEGDIVRTHEELDGILDKVAALSAPEWPSAAEVTVADDDSGPVLYAGFHLALGAAYYSGERDPGPYYTVGSGSPYGEPLTYMYATSGNDMPPNCEIPAELIRKAVHEFADTGRRPTCVGWQAWDRPDASGVTITP